MIRKVDECFFMKRFFPPIILSCFIEYIYDTTSCTNVNVWEIAIWSLRGKWRHFLIQCGGDSS